MLTTVHGGPDAEGEKQLVKAGQHEHEAPRAVSVFDHAGSKTGLSEESGLLVSGNPGNGDFRAQHPCVGYTIDGG